MITYLNRKQKASLRLIHTISPDKGDPLIVSYIQSGVIGWGELEGLIDELRNVFKLSLAI